MSVEYLGAVNGIVTGTDLKSLTGMSIGTLYTSEDITWQKFKYDDKVVLVANNKVLYGVQYGAMASAGCAIGEDIIINKKKFKCRLLTGGNGTPSTEGGGEWDSLIVPFIDKLEGFDWRNTYTLCQEHTANSTYVARGYDSVKGYYTFAYGTNNNSIIWRPVLECYPYFEFSIKSTDLGELLSWSDLRYSVIGDDYTLIEKLDGNVIRELENQKDGVEHILDIHSQWGSIPYGKHTIELIAFDSSSSETKITIKFTKAKPTVVTIPNTSSLKEVIEHSKEIKKEIEHQSLRLKNALIEKGVECSENDNLSSLIDEVNLLKVVSDTPVAGKTVLLYENLPQIITSSTSYRQAWEYLYEGSDGTLTVSFEEGSQSTSYLGIYLIRITRNGSDMDVKTYTGTGSEYKTCYFDIDVCKNDKISIWFKSNSNGRYVYIKSLRITHDYVIL